MPDLYLAPHVAAPPSGGGGGTPPPPVITPPVITPPPGARLPIQMTWTGWDGSVWDLTNGNTGLFITHGVRGLAMPPVEHYTQQGPSLPGSRWRGMRVQDREVFWPLYLYSDTGSMGFITWDRAFWKTMQPDKVGVWTVTQPNGSYRTLNLRFMDDDDHSFDQDPAMAGWELYGVHLFTEQPYWQGPAMTRTWSAAGSVVSFFGTAGPPFALAQGFTTATATLDNPGDVNAYPVYTLTGPWTTASVGVAGRIIDIPFAMTAGQSLVIDTNPDKQTAIDNSNVDRTSQLGAVDFAPVPPGTSLTMSLTINGTSAASAITASLRPSYYRAW